MRKTLFAALLGLLPLVSGCAPALVAGTGVGLMMVDDRRTPGSYLMDQEIEMKAGTKVLEPEFEAVHANFTSFNRRLLITGEAPTEALKARVGEMATKLPNVREVANELVISAPTGTGARANDVLITGKVKTRFLDNQRFSSHHVKVVTENGVVFLMGLVRRDEGDAAAEVAARTAGVTRVVKVFEYID